MTTASADPTYDRLRPLAGIIGSSCGGPQKASLEVAATLKGMAEILADARAEGGIDVSSSMS